MTIVMHWHDWLALWGQYLMLSMLSISGAITTVPDMHRYLVTQNGWLTEAQFTLRWPSRRPRRARTCCSWR